MFILPPPPRAPAAVQNIGYVDKDAPPVESSNAYAQIDGLLDFTAPDGLYKSVECVYLAQPLPHPSDPPPLVLNPLAPTNNLPSSHSAGPKICCVVIGAPPEIVTTAVDKAPADEDADAVYGADDAAAAGDGLDAASADAQPKSPLLAGRMANLNLASSLFSAKRPLNAPVHEANSRSTLEALAGLDENRKRSKPKNSLQKNNSSYVSRTVVSEFLQKRLADHADSDVFVFVNRGRSLSWLDLHPTLTSTNHTGQVAGKHEPLSKILLTKAHPLCLDVNESTKSATNIDVVFGTSSGDAIWFEATTQKYNRINKNADVTRSPVTAIKWIPGSESLFITGHADGTVALFDKDRDEIQFAANGGRTQDKSRSSEYFRVERSINYRDSSSKVQTNPVAVYRPSNSPITSISVKDGGLQVAFTSADGYLRLLNLFSESLEAIFPSYYSGFICCTYSPDGKYLATGGQDDLVCLWNVRDKTLVARCVGHSSWVTSVAFDPYRSDSVTYRLGSVGEDGNLLLWELNPKSIGKARKANKVHTGSKSKNDLIKPFAPKEGIPTIPPVVTRKVHVDKFASEQLSDLKFERDVVLVMGKDGRLWIWRR